MPGVTSQNKLLNNQPDFIVRPASWRLISLPAWVRPQIIYGPLERSNNLTLTLVIDYLDLDLTLVAGVPFLALVERSTTCNFLLVTAETCYCR